MDDGGALLEGSICLPLIVVYAVPTALCAAIATLWYRMNKIVDGQIDRQQQDLDDQRRLALEEAARGRRSRRSR